MTGRGVILAAMVAAGAVAVARAFSVAVEERRANLAGAPYQLTIGQIYALAEALRARYWQDVDPVMLTTMAVIESSGRPGAIRAEPHIGDASIGLMQTLYGTARWLHDDMGYRAYSLPNPDALMDPQVSVYFGGSYVAWLSNWKGIRRTEQWIVESYNGGPNNSNSGTRNHWRKYQDAKARVLDYLNAGPQ
jgi:soluble lytic murein transglycosylase-like protein